MSWTTSPPPTPSITPRAAALQPVFEKINRIFNLYREGLPTRTEAIRSTYATVYQEQDTSPSEDHILQGYMWMAMSFCTLRDPWDEENTGHPAPNPTPAADAWSDALAAFYETQQIVDERVRDDLLKRVAFALLEAAEDMGHDGYNGQAEMRRLLGGTWPMGPVSNHVWRYHSAEQMALPQENQVSLVRLTTLVERFVDAVDPQGTIGAVHE